MKAVTNPADDCSSEINRHRIGSACHRLTPLMKTVAMLSSNVLVTIAINMEMVFFIRAE